MKTTDLQALADHLVALGVVPGRNIVVHSSLTAFGILENGPEGLWTCLRKLAGVNATLAVPTYRLKAPASEVFIRNKSPSQSVGALSEYVRSRPEAVRSANPLHSHAFVGSLADVFADDLPRASFGPGSDFDFFAKNEFLCLMLGCNLENAGTFVFHSQATACTIPYRTWQTLNRTCILSEEAEACSYDFAYYSRVPGAPRETRREIERRLTDAGLLRKAPLHYGTSFSFECQIANQFLSQLFMAEPEICISKTEMD